MSNQSPYESTLFGSTKQLLEEVYNGLADLIRGSSARAQEELGVGITNNRDEILSLKNEVEAVKVMLQSQAEYSADKTSDQRAKENEVDTVIVKKSDEDPQLERAIRELQESNRSLRERHANLEHLHEKLKTEHERLESTHEEVNQKLSATQRSLDDAERRARASRLQVGKLQGHLFKNATNANELIDSHIKAKLEFIRARTQSLVKKFCVGNTGKADKVLSEFENYDAEWAEKEKALQMRYSQEDVEEFRTYWVRGKIYKILERHILSSSVFGLEDDLEEKAVTLERLILKGNPNSDTSDWRALTLRYTKALGMTHRKLPEQTATHLLNLFHPWVVGDPANLITPKNARTPRYRFPAQLKPDLIELCQAAYDLAVMLRQSTDRYHFMSIEEKVKVESPEQEDFEPEDMIGPKSKYVGSKVWVTLFGALIKESPASERHVMVKARVICKAPPPLPDRSGSPSKKAR